MKDIRDAHVKDAFPIEQLQRVRKGMTPKRPWFSSIEWYNEIKK